MTVLAGITPAASQAHPPDVLGVARLTNEALARTVLAFVGHQTALQVARHVQVQREREQRVHLLTHHRVHVERVAHRVEAQDVRQTLEARPVTDSAPVKIDGSHKLVSVKYLYLVWHISSHWLTI